MEKPVRHCHKEYMRMAMLKHEETFKEQVHELHCLYRIQKILMKNMEASKGIEVIQGWNIKNLISLTQNGHHEGAERNNKMKPAMEDISESESDGVLEIITETEIELTLGPSSYNCKKVETQLNSDSGHSWCSSSGSSLINKTRCRTHHTNHATRGELCEGMIGLYQVPHSTSGNSYDIEEQSKQPPWLFQVLRRSM
ncbi:uncharacterized protein LOC130740900 [Lotus japonicus]|uniref:uncharacterized protein LOC130740900 n=1 Tax=Lotus japonicus TaxID=34305 RepID=UPI00258E6F4E|nr:uncharacterized protein LOC130740900 [Lotus japonicus]